MTEDPGAGSIGKLISVVIADDHPVVLEGLSYLLGKEAGLRIVERCGTGAALLAAVRTHRPDLMLLDVCLSAPGGLEVIRALRMEGVQTKVILMSGALADNEVLEGIRLGIRGLVPKKAPVETLLDCVRTVVNGGTCLDQALVGRAMATMLRREAGLRELSGVLTAREIEVACLVGAGFHNRQIAERLFVSPGTLKVHLHHIYEKLHVTNRDELIVYLKSRELS